MPRAVLALPFVALLAAGCGGGGDGGSTHPRTAAISPVKTAVKPSHLTVARIGSLPRAISKASAVTLPHGRLMVLGGYNGTASMTSILAGPPSHLVSIGRLPQRTHDAAAALLGRFVYLFGGGNIGSMPSVVRVDPRTGRGVEAPALDEPLSDLGAVTIGGNAYIVGGFTSTQFASGILR